MYFFSLAKLFQYVVILFRQVSIHPHSWHLEQFELSLVRKHPKPIRKPLECHNHQITLSLCFLLSDSQEEQETLNSTWSLDGTPPLNSGLSSFGAVTFSLLLVISRHLFHVPDGLNISRGEVAIKPLSRGRAKYYCFERPLVFHKVKHTQKKLFHTAYKIYTRALWRLHKLINFKYLIIVTSENSEILFN